MIAVELKKARRRLQGEHRAIQMYTLNFTRFINIPQCGAELYTLAGEAKPVAAVLLAPGGGLTKRHRRLAEAHDVVSCSIRADLENSPSPDAFDRITLRWAIYSADLIALWSAPFPQRADRLRRDYFQAVETGARFLTIIETNERCEPAWTAFIQRWKRKATPARTYAPEIVGGVE
jgi:hypothetical protein